MVDVSIHVGMHKTATTSLQATLRQQAGRLARRGILVSDGSNELGLIKRPGGIDGARAQVEGDLAAAERKGCRRLVYSAEVISTLSSHHLAELTGLFDGHHVTYLVCFRHWTGYLPSRWAQNTKRRDVQSFPEYLAALQRHPQHLDGRFGLVIERIESASPHRVQVVSFNNALAGDGPVAACLRALDLPVPRTRRLRRRRVGEHRNKRREWRDTEFVRLLNASQVVATGLPPNGLFEALGKCEPVEEFFGLARRVNGIRQRQPGFAERVDRYSERHSRDVTLDRADYDWGAWETELEERAGPYLTNPLEGRVFAGEFTGNTRCAIWTLEDVDRDLLRAAASLLSLGPIS